MYMAWCWSSSWWTSISGAPSPLLQLHKGSSRRAEWQNSRRLILSRPSRRTPTRRLSDAASAKASLLNHHYQFHICIAEIQRSMYARKSEGKELRRGRSLDNRTVSSSFGRGSTTIIFTLKNEVGGLIKALKLFQVRFHFLYVDTDMVFSEDACDWPGMNVIRSFYSIFFGCVCVCVCVFAGKTRQPHPHRVPEVQTKEFRLWDLCGLRHRPRAVQGAHRAAQEAHGHRGDLAVRRLRSTRGRYTLSYFD